MKVCSFLILFTLLASRSVTAQTVETIVQNHVTAIGGEAAWKKVHSIKATGVIDAQGSPVKLVFSTLDGKGFRTDYTIMGMTGYSIVTPDAGWYFNPGTGQTRAEPMKADQVKQSQPQLAVQDELIDYQAKGSQVEYEGKETVKGAECYKLRITLKSGLQETWYLDTKTNYLVRVLTKISAPGGAQEQTTDFSRYTKLPEGIVYPMQLTTANGAIKLTSVEVNPPVDLKIFSPAG